jgi:hypothetical protein
VLQLLDVIKKLITVSYQFGKFDFFRFKHFHAIHDIRCGFGEQTGRVRWFIAGLDLALDRGEVTHCPRQVVGHIGFFFS